MNESENKKEYSFDNYYYVVNREYGDNEVNELIKEKLTSEILESHN